MPPSSNRPNAIAVGCGALIVLSIVFSVMAALSAPKEPAIIPVPTYTNTPEPTPTRTPKPTLTPDVLAIYKRQIEPWYRDVLAWSEDLDHEFTVPSADHDAALAALEQRALDLVDALNQIHPPPRHVETHHHISESMEACLEAVRFSRQGKTGYSNIYGGTCTIGLTLMLDVIGRD